MKTNKEYMLREIAGETVLVPTGSASQRLNGMIRLTESAAFIWKQVDTAADLEEIVARVQDEYEVDEDTARRDIYGLLLTWKKLLQECRMSMKWMRIQQGVIFMVFCENCMLGGLCRTYRNWKQIKIYNILINTKQIDCAKRTKNICNSGIVKNWC